MPDFLFDVYRAVFARRSFYKFHKLLYRMSLHGLGILNHKTNKQSGEKHFLRYEINLLNGGVVFDVGANIGNYCSFLNNEYPSCRIYAFEPHPLTYQILLKNTNGRGIKTFNLALGASEGSLTLYDYANNDGSSHASLHNGVIEQIHKSIAIEHRVKLISLDHFVKEQGINHISLLKIDTEGHEFEVLRGADSLLKSGKIEIIHFEFNEMNVFSRVFFRDIWEFLPNYDFYRMLPNGLVPIQKYSPVFCEIFAYQNIVAKLRNVKI
jgi:FkbM family methyltransferase